MSDTLSGHIIGGPVDIDWHGAVLTTALAPGDLVLHVDDAGDFDEDAAKRGARLIVGVELDDDGNVDPATGTALAYTTYDDDTDTITLAAPSSASADVGDRIYIENPVSGLPVGVLEVMVAIDDADTTGDALPAELPLGLLGSTGDVDLTDQAADLEIDEDGQLVVSGLPGLAHEQGDVKFMQDELTVAATGDQTLALTYRPIKNSEHLYWNGMYQKESEWVRDQWTVTIPDPDGVIEAGDVLAMEYAYKDPTPGRVCRTVGFLPGPVSLPDPFPGLPHHAGSVVVGGAPQWSDNSDASYATIHSATADGYSGSDFAEAPLPTLAEMGADTGDVTTAALFVRMSATILDVHPAIYVVDTAGALPVAVFADIGSAAPGFTGSGVPVDVVYGLASGSTLADLEAALAAGSLLHVEMSFDPGRDLTVHEARLDLTVCTGGA